MYNRIRVTPSLMRRPLLITAMAALLWALLMVPAPATAAPEKILILPFTIHAEKDMAFLNQGIVSMLLSRLTKPGKTVTEAVTALPDTPKKVVELARSRGAKYYTTGSLTLFGNSVSTDARLIETDSGKTVVAYNQYGERAGDVLAHMDAFARQVDAQLSAAAPPKAAAPVSASASAPSAAAPAAAAATAATAVAAGTAAAVAAPKAATPMPAAPATPAPSLPAPGVKMTMPAAAPVVAVAAAPASVSADIPFFESQGFTEEIRSLTTGDIDGDGITEIIFAGADRLSVMRFQDGKLIPITGYNSPREYPIITVDTADLNGDGKSEIFVTRINEMAQSRDPNVRQWGINSIVLESQNDRLAEIAAGLPYYFRAIDTPDAGRVVLGQRRGTVVTYGELETVTSRSNTGSLFLGNVFYLAYQNGAYVPGETVLLPGLVTIYDFAMGDILNDGSDIITALTGKGYLTLLDVGGKNKWKGKDRYGGSSVYLEYPSIEGTSQMDRYYLRQRLFVLDIDQDDQNEVVLVNNYDFSMSLASRVRLYQNGTVACLSWGKRSLMRKWDTEEMNGFIADLAITDIDADDRKELIYAVVEKTKDSFSDGKSFIVIQNPPSPGDDTRQ